MIPINLPTGKTIFVPAHVYYLELEDDDIDEFFRTCIADDLGVFTDNPFSDAVRKGVLEITEEESEIICEIEPEEEEI